MKYKLSNAFTAYNQDAEEVDIMLGANAVQ